MNELKISTHGGWVDGVNNVTITVTKDESAYMVNSEAAGYVSMKTPHNVGSVQEAAEEVARLSIYTVTGRWLADAA